MDSSEIVNDPKPLTTLEFVGLNRRPKLVMVVSLLVPHDLIAAVSRGTDIVIVSPSDPALHVPHGTRS
jgi:hypothetical protein